MKNLVLFAWLLLVACVDNSEVAPTTNEVFPKSTTAKEFVKIWNDLINQRDWEQLAQLYAPEVYVYGKKKSRQYCIAAKKKYMEQHPVFQQKVKDFYVKEVYYQAEYVSFSKTYRTASGGEKTVQGILNVVKNAQGYWEIREETDVPSWRKTKQITSCLKFWQQLLRTNPIIKEYDQAGSYSLSTSFDGDEIRLVVVIDGEFATTTIERFTFSLEEKKLYQNTLGLDYKDGKVLEYDTKLLLRMEEFCQ